MKDKIKLNKTQYIFNNFCLDLMGLKLPWKISAGNFGNFQPKKKNLIYEKNAKI